MTDSTPGSSIDVGATPRVRAEPPDSKGAAAPGPRGRVGEARLRRAIGWRSRDIIRAAGLVLAMYLALRLVWFANALFLVSFLGILFGIAVSSGVDQLQRIRIPRGAGAALIVLSFFGGLVGVGAWVAPTLRTQGAELRQKLPEAADRVQEWISKRQSGVFGIFLGGGDSAGKVAAPGAAATPNSARTQPARATTPVAIPPGSGAGTAGAPPAGSIVAAPTGAGTVSPQLKDRLQEKLSGASRYLFPFLTHTVEAIGGILIIVFLSIYLAADPQLYRRGILALVPERRRAQGAEVMDRVAIVLRKWLITQLIAMVVIGSVTTIVLLLLDVKAAFALGMLAGLFEFIPTVGPLLSAIPGVAMGFLDSPEKAGAVAIAYWGIQFLENHILIPLLMKGGMDLPPALTVVTQALLALVFGFLGLVVAIPLLATVMVMVQVLYLEPRAAASAAAANSGAPDRFDPELDESLGEVAAR